jgi:hypothetical protein
MARVVIPTAGAISDTDNVLVRIGREGFVREIPVSALMGLVSTDVLNDAYVPKTGTDAKGNRVVTGIGRAVVSGAAGPKTDPVRVLVDDLWVAQGLFPLQSGPARPFKYTSGQGYRVSDGWVDTSSLVANAVTHQFQVDNPDGVAVNGTSNETLVDITYTPEHSGELLLLAGAQVTLSWIAKPYPEATTAFWRLVTGSSAQRWDNRALFYQTPVLSATGTWTIIASTYRAYSLPVTSGSSTRCRLQGRLDVSGRAVASFAQNTLHGILLKR